METRGARALIAGVRRVLALVANVRLDPGFRSRFTLCDGYACGWIFARSLLLVFCRMHGTCVCVCECGLIVVCRNILQRNARLELWSTRKQYNGLARGWMCVCGWERNMTQSSGTERSMGIRRARKDMVARVIYAETI